MSVCLCVACSRVRGTPCQGLCSWSSWYSSDIPPPRLHRASLAGAAGAAGTASAQPHLAGVAPRVPMTLDLTPVASNQLSAQQPTFMQDATAASLNTLSSRSSVSLENAFLSQTPLNTLNGSLVSSLSRQNSSMSRTSTLSRQQTLTSPSVAFGGGALGQAGPLLLDKTPKVMADVAWPLKPNPPRLTSALPAHAGGGAVFACGYAPRQQSRRFWKFSCRGWAVVRPGGHWCNN